MLKYVEIEEILDSVTLPDVEFSSTDEALCVLVRIRKERNKLIRVLKSACQDRGVITGGE
jgi:hypothetical protein